ncbi:hypothetical protein BpHYR1_015464 [Brachionus plicatilis]|uniref:Uncharacterized protein n=1 Tax=Brachionus plicatilis TaxID=10195 RepID=A0A3M7Q3V3_BRAPC|nr:hypothetical protein BpHYR1_015464 [Brachionus plicatilis]
MKEVLTGFCESQPIIKKGPRIKKEAQENYMKNKGSFNFILNEYGKGGSNECTKPRVYYEGKYNNEKGRGSVGNLFTNYGNLPLSARPVPRVKFEAENILDHNRGSGVNKTLHMVPESSRPKSTTFFNFKF